MISCLVFAFAQPYWKEKGDIVQEGKSGVQIYLDNSFSMQASAKQGMLFDKAKQQALNIIKAYDLSDRFQIMDNSFENNPDRWLNREAAIQKLQNIEISPLSRPLSEVLNRFKESESDEFQEQLIYLISDFQKSLFDISATDSMLQQVKLVSLDAANNQNISLNKLDFERPFHLPLQAENLKAKLVRHGPSDKEKIPMKLMVDGSLKAPLSLEFGKEDSLEATLSFQSGVEEYQSGFLLIKDYPITFDDTLFFNYKLKNQIKVTHIYEEKPNRGLNILFSQDSLFNYSSTAKDQINYSEVERSSLLILDELTEYSSGNLAAIQKYLENKGNIIFIPPNDPQAAVEVNKLLSELNAGILFDLQRDDKMRVDRLNRNADLYQGVFETIPENLDLPLVKSYWLVSQGVRSMREDLIWLKGDLPFLSKLKLNNGAFYFFSAPLNDSATSFSRHALFVPTMYNIALYAQERQPLYYTLGEDQLTLKDLEAKESPIHLIGKGLDLIPPQEYREGQLSIELDESLLEAGHYELQRDGEMIGMISLNYSRKESDYQLMQSEDFEELGAEAAGSFDLYDEENESLIQAIQSERKGNSLWKYFIIFALIFMGIEIALLRLIK
tara:strand:+ start:1174 stop:3009 length:1836 start_codon:yes stop_codon:yes gene_type:complete